MDTPDRISQLPEPILQHILSFLPAKDVVRMTTVSKIWINAWNSLSDLNFGDDFFAKQVEMRNLLKVVTQTLAKRHNQKISIQKFWIHLPYWRRRSYYVRKWINLLVACDIKELNLSVTRIRPRSIYEINWGYGKLPEVIFDAKALNVLTLSGFKIELPFNSRTIMLSSLRELHLCSVFVDEKFIQAVCTSCRNLEVLALMFFDGLSGFQVGERELPKLKKLNLEFCPREFEMVDVASINLEDLHIYSHHQDLKLVKLTACKSLKSLFLSCVAVTEIWLEKLFSSLQNLEKVYLFRCNTLRTMKISSYQLKKLTVVNCPKLVNAEVYTPNLIHFCYDRSPLPTLKLKASGLLGANISFDLLEIPDSDWYSKLTNFLVNFNNSIAIKISSKNDEVIVIPKDIRVNLLPPLHATNNLHVNIQKRLKYSVVDIVDSLLWIAPQLNTISFGGTLNLKTLKFIHEDASNEDEMPCCASLPWKCWRHKLKQVKMQNFSYMEQQELRYYFFTNADVLEIIDVPPECVRVQDLI